MKRSRVSILYAMLGLVRPLWLWMVCAVGLGALGFFCSIMITVFGALGILKALGAADPFSWPFFFGMLAVFGIGRGVLRYGEQASNHYIAFKLLALIRDRVFTALRRLCPAKLEGRGKGDLISRLTSDVELLEVFYAHTISPILIALLMSILMSLLIAGLHPLLGVYALVSYAIVGIVLPLLLSRRCSDLGMQSRQRDGAFSSYLLESLRGLTQTLQYADGEARLASIRHQSEELSKSEGELRIQSGKGSALTGTVIHTLSLLMLGLCCLLHQQGMISSAGVLLGFVTLLSSFGPVTALAKLGVTLQNTLASGERILELLEEEPLVEENREGREVSDGDLELTQVSFAYEEEQILNDVSLQIRSHQMTGIHGPSGSGKSTLLKLLMRFWDVDMGSVRIGNDDVRDLRTTALRAHESYMTQDTHLFHDTIENNIRFVRPQATHEEVVEACRKASIHDFILSLPQGYATNVAELGDSLSGGERQRIGLARVFLYDAKLVLLDEPTSNLDSLNEAVILKALDEEKQEKTIVLVSHRPSTLRICDVCMEADFGRKRG